MIQSERGNAMSNPWYISEAELLLRLVISVVLGGIVGFERERKSRAAGLRTHVLVCLGSCLLMLLSMYGFAAFAREFNVRLDPARLAAQVITGVGFLGAGTILFTGRAIIGLTTAASLWVVMAVGLATGAGFYLAAAATTVMSFLVLWGLSLFEKRFIRHLVEHEFTVVMEAEEGSGDRLREVLRESGVRLAGVIIEDRGADDREKREMVVRLRVKLSGVDQVMPLSERLRRVEGVRRVSAN